MKGKGCKIAIFGSIFAIILSILIIINVDTYKQTYELEKYRHIASDFDKFCLFYAIEDTPSQFYDALVPNVIYWAHSNNVNNALDLIQYAVSLPDAHFESEDAFIRIKNFLGIPGREMARIDLATIEYERKEYWDKAILCFIIVINKAFERYDYWATHASDADVDFKLKFEDDFTNYVNSIKAAVSADMPVEEFYNKLYDYLMANDK